MGVQRRVAASVEMGICRLSHAEELKVWAMVCQVERREGAPQMELGCLWWRIFLAMVCLRMECEVVKLEWVIEDLRL